MNTPRQRAGMIRSYTPTGGVATPSHHGLDRFTVLTATSKPLWGLGPEPYRVMTLCAEGRLSIAEVGYYLQLPGAVTTVVVSRLIDSEHLLAAAPLPVVDHDEHFLERLLHALERL